MAIKLIPGDSSRGIFRFPDVDPADVIKDEERLFQAAFPEGLSEELANRWLNHWRAEFMRFLSERGAAGDSILHAALEHGGQAEGLPPVHLSIPGGPVPQVARAVKALYDYAFFNRAIAPDRQHTFRRLAIRDDSAQESPPPAESPPARPSVAKPAPPKAPTRIPPRPAPRPRPHGAGASQPAPPAKKTSLFPLLIIGVLVAAASMR
jgi:hypothetical protein